MQRRLESLSRVYMDGADLDAGELKTLFLHFCSTFKTAFLVIDGLAETERSDQTIVKHFFRDAQKLASVRILAMTHPDIHISKVLSSCQILQIEAKDLKSDIATFVQMQVDEHQEQLSICPSPFLGKIQEILLSNAEEM